MCLVPLLTCYPWHVLSWPQIASKDRTIFLSFLVTRCFCGSPPELFCFSLVSVLLNCQESKVVILIEEDCPRDFRET